MARSRRIYSVLAAANEPDRAALVCLRHRIAHIVTDGRSAPITAGAASRGIRVEVAADVKEAAALILASTLEATAVVLADDDFGRTFAADLRRRLARESQSIIDLD